jgi:hypothetical protein
MLRRKAVAVGSQVKDALAESNAAPAAHPASGHIMPMAAVAAHTAAPSAQVRAMEEITTAHNAIHQAAITATGKTETTGEGFKRFASAGALSIDDIVKGLSRESGMEFSMPEAVAPAAPVAMVEAPAEPVREVAPAPAPIRASAPVAAPVHAEVPGFISMLLAGEKDQVFALVRRMNQAGQDVEEFMAHAICSLDDAYRARIDGTPVHEDVKRVTEHCATPFLERLVTSLTTAVDGSYSMGVTGIKLAITRALAVAQG